jgi:hypothetical protein
MVERTDQDVPPVLGTVVGERQFDGVGAQQVVHRVPAGPVLGDQVRADQLVQQRRGEVGRDPGAPRGGQTEVGAGMQAERAEQGGRVRAQRPVRP